MDQLLHAFRARIATGFLVVISVVVSTGCATGKSVKSADDIIDDGERNTMVVSYDITLNVTDKHPKVSRTRLIVRCGSPNRVGIVPECFRISVPLKGRTTANEFIYYSFSTTGTSALQMPYGSFPITSLNHRVVVDVEQTVECRKAKNGRTTCRPVSKDITTSHRGKTDQLNSITVEPGPGCYAGHMTIVMQDSELSTFSLDQTNTQLSAEQIALLPVEIQDTVRGRVTQPCLPG